MNIYLVGMPGSGKTALGRALANKFSLTFMDTDEEVSRLHGMTPEDMILAHGENELREAELGILDEVLKTEGLLVATGGGFPVFNHIMDRLNENGLTVYLSYDLETLWLRLQESHGRPLAKNEKELQKLLEKRISIYNKATLVYRGKRDFTDNLEHMESLIDSFLKKQRKQSE